MILNNFCWKLTGCLLSAALLAACTTTKPAQLTAAPVAATGTVVPTKASVKPSSEPTMGPVEDEIDLSARYLFYLHGKIIEDQGLPAVSTSFGKYEYEAILETLRGYGFVVRSEQREKNADVLVYAEKTAAQVRELLDAGVPPENITVVGASKGAGITLYASNLLKNSEVNFVPMAICHPDVVSELIWNEVAIYGNVLSIYDSADDFAGSCKELFAFSGGKGLSNHGEIVLDVGSGHGILYQPLDAWVLPVVAWANNQTELAEVRPEFERYFAGNPGAFVLYDLKADHYIRHNPGRCAERFLPASTFKILNSLIGLETNIIPDENYVIPWDGTDYHVPAWHQDHTLQTAIRNSVVWYYQELARRVGEEQMRAWVKAADYGNADISGNLDSFWLDGALRISPDEQVEFLKRLYLNELPFSQRSMDSVKEVIVLEETDTYKLSGKTGSAIWVEIYQGWFVGYLEMDDNVYFFATNFESDDSNGFANGENAKKISLEILQELGLLP